MELFLSRPQTHERPIADLDEEFIFFPLNLVDDPAASRTAPIVIKAHHGKF
jgi:hypothetical protein